MLFPMKKISLITTLLICSMSAQAQDNEFLAKVKTLGAQATASAATGAAGVLNKTAGAVQPAGPDADVIKAIDTLKQQVEASMVAFQKSSAPDEEKMKQFDKVLSEFDAVIQQTQQGGALDQLIMQSVSVNQKRLSLMRQRSNDTSIPSDQREAYNQKIQGFEKQIQQSSDKRAVLIRQTAQLMTQRDQVEKSKQFYLDMISVQDLESANKSLDAVLSAQSNLMDNLSNLGAKLMTPSSGPTKQ